MSIREILYAIHEEDKKIVPAIKKTIPQMEKLITKILERMEKGGRVFYTGAGTSGRLGVLDASEIPPTFGIEDLFIGVIAGGDSALRKAIESAEDDFIMGWEDLQKYNIGIKDTVIGLTTSGQTPYVMGAVSEAKKRGLLTACITCNLETEIARMVDFPIVAIVGPEFVTGSTRMKAGSAEKLILNAISTSLMIKMGRVKGNMMVHMRISNKKLKDRGVNMIMDSLCLEKAQAEQLLFQYGSINKVLATKKKNNLLDCSQQKEFMYLPFYKGISHKKII